MCWCFWGHLAPKSSLRMESHCIDDLCCGPFLNLQYLCECWVSLKWQDSFLNMLSFPLLQAWILLRHWDIIALVVQLTSLAIVERCHRYFLSSWLCIVHFLNRLKGTACSSDFEGFVTQSIFFSEGCWPYFSNTCYLLLKFLQLVSPHSPPLACRFLFWVKSWNC